MSPSNSVDALFSAVLRDENNFEANLSRWRERWAPFSSWESDWQSAKSLEALVEVYARAASREELVEFVCLCLRPLTNGRGAINELTALIDVAEQWTRKGAAREALSAEMQRARTAMAGATARSPRRRYALAAAESMVRAATVTNKRGRVRYESQATNAIVCVVYAAGTKRRDEMFAKLTALFRARARCPSLEEVLLGERLVRAELTST